LLSRPQLEKELGFRIESSTVLFIYHPVTLKRNTLEEAEEVFAAIAGLSHPVIFIYPNADAGSRELIRRTQELAANGGARVLVNLDHRTYLSLLKHVGVLVGNSSSGIIESTSLEVPAVNVGIRQRGREHAQNVIDVPAERGAIQKAIRRALSPEFRKSIRGLASPYGEGKASKIVTEVLVNAPLGDKLLFKHSDLL